uniref:Uncharacterized protein n=1 Tax=Rhizophora mucronata TaxID=61149 RepID=A0A2P2INM2_RHIMU
MLDEGACQQGRDVCWLLCLDQKVVYC